MFDYASMQATATGILNEFQQGIVSIRRETKVPGANPWDPPTITTVDTQVLAAVRRMHERYVNGAMVKEEGDSVIFNAGSITPLLTDKIVIDGTARAITNLTPIPAAGTPVVYKAWCAA
jgi:hypothetical protein